MEGEGDMTQRHGGQILVDALKVNGVERVFSVPGESFLAALDGLYESGIENTVCRQEGGAAMMAEAWGKMSGRPGVLFVTRGPGAANASAGLHVAMQDSTPLICFVGQVPRHHRDREAFQEVDYRDFFGGFVKWATEVDQTERLPEYIDRAFRTAMAGRPGPVVLALPEDMLAAQAEVPDRPPAVVPEAAVPDMGALMRELARYERPLVLAGGSAWSQAAAEALARFAEVQGLPVATSFRRQDFLDNRHPNYVGDMGVGMNPALHRRLGRADALLVLGARLTDPATSGYEALDPTGPQPAIFHIHPAPEVPGRVYPAARAYTCRAADAVAALAELPPVAEGRWAEWTADARAEYEDWVTPRESPGAVKLERVVRHLAEVLPEDAILTNGAGNYAAWLHRYYLYRRHNTCLAPTSGSMGYGFPAAVAAKLRYPEREVICLAGDGCFQMTLNECSTAMQYGAAPVVIVANNGRYGTIRMHQEKTYPGRVSGTDLASPDFAALARAYGGQGWVVERQEDFPQALEEARAAGVLAVIELKLDPEALSTGMTLSDARRQGEKKG
jgi:acetolactate synthase-1/2/3 large subunit